MKGAPLGHPNKNVGCPLVRIPRPVAGIVLYKSHGRRRSYVYSVKQLLHRHAGGDTRGKVGA